MMARIETLSAYRCTFSYLQRNNPLKEELQEKIKADIPPEYTFADFIEDFCKATSSLAKGEVTERAIMLPEENVYSRPSESGVKKWRIVPYAGKQGKPFRIIKTTTGKNMTSVPTAPRFMNTIYLCIKMKIRRYLYFTVKAVLGVKVSSWKLLIKCCGKKE